MKNPILSLCIPTYNRPDKFERMIDGVIPQLSSDVEIVIRDDGSTLDTKKIVEEKIVGKFDLQYFKGDRIGLDLANLFLLEKARGDYVWWFSDDDELETGAIEHVIGILKRHSDINFIWANFSFGEDKRIAVNLGGERFFRDKNEPLEVLGKNIGLLSTLIINRKKALPYVDLAKKNSQGFAFAALIPVLGALSEKGRLYFLQGPYVWCHPTTVEEIRQIVTKGEEIKNNGFDVYGVNFYEIVMLFKGKFKYSSIKKMLNDNLGFLWRGMIVGWMRGYDTPKGKRLRMLKYYWNFPEAWVAVFFMILPLGLNKLMYRIYKIFFEHRKFKYGK